MAKCEPIPFQTRRDIERLDANGGMTPRDIADALDVSLTIVRRVLRASGRKVAMRLPENIVRRPVSIRSFKVEG